MNLISAIDKRKNISKKELYHEYVKKGLPVVIQDGTKNWEAMNKLTPDYFKKNYGNLEKKIGNQNFTLAEIIDRMLEENPERPSPYPCNINIQKVVPELLPFFKPHIHYGFHNRVFNPLVPKPFLKGTEVCELYFGGKGSFFPTLHIDALYLHTQITQIYGRKEFYLFPPEQTQFMYPRADNPKLSSIENPIDPDFSKFPLFKNTKPLKIMVEPGETILFASGWWHYTRMYEPSISYGLIQLNEFNYDSFVSDNITLIKKYNPRFAIPLQLYSKMAGTMMTAMEKFM